MGWFLVLNYESDSERKRIDYAIERWRNRINIKKPKGMTIVLEGNENDFRSFLEDIFSRIDVEPDRIAADKVEIYRIEKYRPEISAKTKRLYYETTEKEKTVKKFFDYLMAKLNASYEYSTGAAIVYTAYTKKGQARIEVRIDGKEITRVEILIEGYGEAVDFVAGRIYFQMVAVAKLGNYSKENAVGNCSY